MRYGMTKELGFVTYEESGPAFLETKESFTTRAFSDETARRIDETVKEIVMRAYERAFHFLEEHRPLLEEAARNLREHETMNEDELKQIFHELDHEDEKKPELHH